MKTTIIGKALWPIVESMSHSDMLNGYFGGSNLAADYLNDFSADGINRFMSDFIEDNVNKNPLPDGLDVSTIIENPDSIIEFAASEFVSALHWLAGDKAEWILRNANTHFEPWGNFYVFANADIACAYIIRADNESDAYKELVTRFESAFAVDESDEYNDNGTPINTGYLTLIGKITE